MYITSSYLCLCRIRQVVPFFFYNSIFFTITVERQSSETSNIRTHIFFVLRSNNEKSAITSRNKVLCHFYEVLYFVCTILHCNGNIISEKPLDFMHCVASRFGCRNYRWSQLVRIFDVLLYLNRKR